MNDEGKPHDQHEMKFQKLQATVEKFVLEECIPAEKEYKNHMSNRIGKDRWSIDAIPPCIERLKFKAKKLGLWNLFLPKHILINEKLHTQLVTNNILTLENKPCMFLTNVEYAKICESMGKSFIAPEVCNCNAPDTGNMEVLLHFGTVEQQIKHLKPLLDGTIRSAFLMTEPNVASSDASNIETKLIPSNNENNNNNNGCTYVLSGRKWWSTGAMDPRCKVAIILAKMDNNNNNNIAMNSKSFTTMVVPMSRKGVNLVRPLTVFGNDDAPHGHAEVQLNNVIINTSEDIILGIGKGYTIAQARLGPGRVHHCMRAIGITSRCYELMIQRTIERKTFNKQLYFHGMIQEIISKCKIHLDSARLLTLDCAYSMDTVGATNCKEKIALIKIAVPNLCFKVVDNAVQVFGGAGVSDDYPIASAFTSLRTLRIADGPDEVHKRTLARLEVKKVLLQNELKNKEEFINHKQKSRL